MARPKGSGITAPEIRFWRKVQPASVDDCWIWKGTLSRGYGRFFLSSDLGNVLAHRFAYEHLRAEIPAGLVLDHLCCNPRCVNPWHLEPVTQHVNSQRWSETVTHCPAGHPYELVGAKGKGCRQCDADHHYANRGIGSARWKYPDYQPVTRPAGPVTSLDLTT